MGSNFMRQQAMQSKMSYGRPIPVGRAVQGIADRAQNNTQQYGRRPYGVGFLVIGRDVCGADICIGGRLISIGDGTASVRILTFRDDIRVLCSFHRGEESECKDIPGAKLCSLRVM